MRRSFLMMPLAVTLLVAAAACGGSGDDSSTDLTGVDVSAESSDAASRGNAPTDETMVKGVSELFVQEDPTVNPSATAGANADAIAAQATDSISGCASAAVTHTSGAATLSINFGTGCTYSSVGTISGTVAVTVAVASGAATVSISFTSLVVNGTSLTGTASLTTSNGTSYTAQMDLTDGGHVTTFDGTLVLNAAGNTVTINGTGTSQTSSGPVSFIAAGIQHQLSGCWADAGTLTLTKSEMIGSRTVQLTEVITYSSTTPTTGQVTVKINSAAPTTETLPAHGSCG